MVNFEGEAVPLLKEGIEENDMRLAEYPYPICTLTLVPFIVLICTVLFKNSHTITPAF